MKLYLIGLPGSGKSFLGKQLADEMNLPFIDLDKVIERETGISILRIFSEKGEDYFRSLEAAALRQESKKSEFVMACGGGTPCFYDNMKFINESGTSILLNTPVSKIVARLTETEKQNRPLIAENKSLEEKLMNLFEKRKSFYHQATVIVHDSTSTADIHRLIKIESYRNHAAR